MIASQVVHEVRRLLAEGKLSQRKVARLLRVSRGTVGAIATGRRPDYELLRRARSEDDSLEPTGPPERCPSCGAMVYLPCRACRMRRAMAQSPTLRRIRGLNGDDPPLGLQLRSDHQTRYEQVRLRKLASLEAEATPEEQYDLGEPDDAAPALGLIDIWDAFGAENEEPELDEVGVSGDDEPERP